MAPTDVVDLTDVAETDGVAEPAAGDEPTDVAELAQGASPVELVEPTGDAEPTDPSPEGPDSKTLAASMRDELDAVEAALSRLDDETYGLCATCAEPINDEVLASAPTATLCGQHA